MKNDILCRIEKYLVVGSFALQQHFPEYQKSYKDIDVICFRSDFEKIKNEFSTLMVGEHDSLIGQKNEIVYEFLFADHLVSFQKYLEIENGIASPAILFSLKKGHIHFPISFHKHIKNYVFLGEKLNWKDELSEITKIHTQETETRLGKNRTPKLNQTLEQFFGQSEKYVPYVFVHDEVHEIMAHKEKPMFEYMRDDKALAKCSKRKWNHFSFEEKSYAVLEEAYVIALERKILPGLFRAGEYNLPEDAFSWALMRICTNLTSGWFREFATNNYYKIQEFYNSEYVTKFLNAVDEGIIKPKYSC